MCIQRKANKTVPDEQAFITANIASFGDDIGKTTNRITSMFEKQSHFEKGSDEYEILDYRIKCGQLYQQNCIDKAKGIVSKPMPKEWYDYHSAAKIEDEDMRNLYTSLLAEKKVYFQRYIYPALDKEYREFMQCMRLKVRSGSGMDLEELLQKEDRTEYEQKLVDQYYRQLPVGIGDCVMNKICRRFESEFDGFRASLKDLPPFDHSIYKCGVEYKKSHFYAIKDIYKEYLRLTSDFMSQARKDRVDKDEIANGRSVLLDWFRTRCDAVCSDEKQLCDILVDICYTRESSKQFAWSVVGDMMVDNLLKRNDYYVTYPVQDDHGDIAYAGKTFSSIRQKIGGWTF